MKAKLITYSRLISKGNFENAKIEIQVEVEDNEIALDVFNKAKTFVNKLCEIEKISQMSIENAKKVLNNKREYTLGQIEDADELLSRLIVDNELPF